MMGSIVAGFKMTNCVIYILCLYFGSVLVEAEVGTKCYKNEEVGDRDGNVYYCEDETLSECCTEDNQYTCCEPTATKSLREQLILWGCVSGVLLLMFLACGYFWKDSLCGQSDTPLSQKCCCCRKTKEEDKKALTPIPGEAPGCSHGTPPYSLNPWKGNGSYDVSGHCETPPPFNYKSPSYKQY